MIFPHTVIVHPSELVTDPDGNPVRRPAPVGVPAAAFVQPITSTEDTAAQGAESRHVAYLDPDAPRLDSASRVVWDGQGFDTVGEALWFTDPDQTVSFWRVTLRRTGV